MQFRGILELYLKAIFWRSKTEGLVLNCSEQNIDELLKQVDLEVFLEIPDVPPGTFPKHPKIKVNQAFTGFMASSNLFRRTYGMDIN